MGTPSLTLSSLDTPTRVLVLLLPLRADPPRETLTPP